LSNVGNIGATSVVPMDSFVNTIRVLDQPILDKIKKQHKFSIKYFHWPDTIPLSSYVLPDDVFAC